VTLHDELNPASSRVVLGANAAHHAGEGVIDDRFGGDHVFAEATPATSGPSVTPVAQMITSR